MKPKDTTRSSKGSANPYSVAEQLTPEEQEDLRRDMREADEYARRAFAKPKPDAPTWIMYDVPPRFGNTSVILPLWEAHLKDIQGWPESARNKESAIQYAEREIARQKTAKENAGGQD